ncbi:MULTISPECIES: carboxylesterase family protein [Azospirillaceae]|uniref:carboxylesterase/lipase family protein n=1 Tax=Azospirillaceae TaxID=2829815 RepID=UPI000B68B861|nr:MULTISPECIES: carboxylesterase family protein [Azospirillaceae]MDG5497214.1 carboxylesterase family protein [Niveispirillum sp. BGYR6]SNS51366.1 para-nitrobenzyl esterase [Azospirillum sp. RU38E]SNS70201.1 para-nitrobenzyl esterase [Azospirillum sp. RU37A]
MRFLIAASLIAFPFLAVAAQAANVTVTVEAGALEGVEENGVRAFKGIPFAAPPVGDLRWRAPVPPASWTDVRSAKSYGNDCQQVPFAGDAAPLGGPLGEDCLYLNVWTPVDAKPGVKYPVMFWIYGGGFVNGGTSPGVYDGTAFARNGVILVSANYRIGRLGFFAHPALTAEAGGGPTGNFGFMDQLAALKWVQRNIAAFGGDPANVTIFGESAGGRSVHVLQSLDAGRGLFSRAIMMSGAGRPGSVMSMTDQKTAEEKGVAYARSVGITDTGPAGLAALRALPASTLGDASMASLLKTGDHLMINPHIDGRLVTDEPERLLAAGHGSPHIPVMVGATGMDGFPLDRDPERALAGFGSRADEARRLYASPNDLIMVWKIAGDRGFIEPARYVMRAAAARKATSFGYRFSYIAQSQQASAMGAMHASEIPFVFRTINVRFPGQVTPTDEATSQAIHDYFVSFARNGVPTANGGPEWLPYNAAADKILDFTLQGPRFIDDSYRARLDLVESTAP